MTSESDLAARVASCEAMLRTGAVGSTSTKEEMYPFLNRLEGEDLIEAQTLVHETTSLRELAESLQDEMDQLNYRIGHLKKSIDVLMQK